MMSLKPRNVDFTETWAHLKETVAGVVGLRAVERSVWNTRFSDVYALCVAHPEPLADRLYDETRNFLEEHVAGLLQRVRGAAALENNDHNDGLLTRYVSAWREYSQGVAYLNSLYSYLNLQHVKRQKVSDAEIIYGSSATVTCPEHDARQLEVGELGLEIWERVLIKPLSSALTGRIVRGLGAARQSPLDPALSDTLREAIRSTVAVRAFRLRGPLQLYQALVLEPYLAAAAAAHAQLAADLLAAGDVAHYTTHALAGLDREVSLGARYLDSSSAEAVRACYERAAVAAHLPALHATVAGLLRAAAGDPASPAAPAPAERRADLRRMYTLLRPLGAAALRPLVDAAHAQAAADGRALLAQPHSKDEAHTHFVNAMLSLHGKYSKLFNEVFGGAQAFVGALDKACSAVVNSGGGAPELLARYCDCLLRRRAAADADVDDKLAAAIVVFKYVDDKDVFQKYYARALARRLIHQLSASMEQEEAMINRRTEGGVRVRVHEQAAPHVHGRGCLRRPQRQVPAAPAGQQPRHQHRLLHTGPAGGRVAAGRRHGPAGAAAAAGAAGAAVRGVLPQPVQRAAPGVAAPPVRRRAAHALHGAPVPRRRHHRAVRAAAQLRGRRQLERARPARPAAAGRRRLAAPAAPAARRRPAAGQRGSRCGRGGDLPRGDAVAEPGVQLQADQGARHVRQRAGAGRGRGGRRLRRRRGGLRALRRRQEDVPAGRHRAHHEAAQGTAAHGADPGGSVPGARLVRALCRHDQEMHRSPHRQAVPGEGARGAGHVLVPRVGYERKRSSTLLLLVLKLIMFLFLNVSIARVSRLAALCRDQCIDVDRFPYSRPRTSRSLCTILLHFQLYTIEVESKMQ